MKFDTNSPWLGRGVDNFAGMIGEVLIYSRALKPMERFAVESYLSQRFTLVTNPPATPSRFAAFAVSTNQVLLTWSNALSNTNVSYLIQRSTTGGCYADVALVPNGLSYLDRDLAAGTPYFYRIKAVNYSGQSALSVETNVTTLNSGEPIPLSSLKLWLKGDCGHGAGAVNCWVDQTTNNNSVYFDSSRAAGAPRWLGFNTNGHPVISFWGTNAFVLPAFLAAATQAEAMVVVRSFGSTATNWVALWLMSDVAINSYYPYTNNFIWDNFGRTVDSVQFSSGLAALSNMHLYNPMSKTGVWSAAFNNGTRYVNNTNTPSFPTDTINKGLLGRGANSFTSFLNGEITELMVFDRELTQTERDAIGTNYLNKRFNLW